MSAITVVLVEPQEIFLHGLERNLEKCPQIQVVGTSTSGKWGIELIRELSPDVAVIALQMTDLDGLSLLKEIKGLYGTRPLVLTAESSDDMIFDCMMAGAQGYLVKYAIVNLAESIQRVQQGEVVMSPESLRLFIQATSRRLTKELGRMSVPSVLTGREREILELVGAGHNQQAIAQLLHLSRSTVKTHLRNAYTKLGVRGSAHAVQEALQLGLIDRRDNHR